MTTQTQWVSRRAMTLDGMIAVPGQILRRAIGSVEGRAGQMRSMHCYEFAGDPSTLVACSKCGERFTSTKYLSDHILETHDRKPEKVETDRMDGFRKAAAEGDSFSEWVLQAADAHEAAKEALASAKEGEAAARQAYSTFSRDHDREEPLTILQLEVLRKRILAASEAVRQAEQMVNETRHEARVRRTGSREAFEHSTTYTPRGTDSGTRRLRGQR